MSVIKLTGSNIRKEEEIRKYKKILIKKSQRYTILTPKYCRKDQRSCDGWGGGQGASYFIASVVQWKEKSP